MGTSGKALREMQKKEERNKVLKEVGIYDRKFDRSVLFANKYRPREIELDRIEKEKYLAMVAERDAKEEEEERLLMASVHTVEGNQIAQEGGVAIDNNSALSVLSDGASEPLTNKSSEKWLSANIAVEKEEARKVAAAPRSILKKTRVSNFADDDTGGEKTQTPKKKITFVDGDVEGPTNPEYVEMKLVLYEGEENYEVEGEAEVQPAISTPRSNDKGQSEGSVASDESKGAEADTSSEPKDSTKESHTSAIEETKIKEPYRERPLVDDDKSYDVNTYEPGRITKSLKMVFSTCSRKKKKRMRRCSSRLKRHDRLFWPLISRKRQQILFLRTSVVCCYSPRIP